MRMIIPKERSQFKKAKEMVDYENKNGKPWWKELLNLLFWSGVILGVCIVLGAYEG